MAEATTPSPASGPVSGLASGVGPPIPPSSGPGPLSGAAGAHQTGSIPLSWARPAEDVTQARTQPPRSFPTAAVVVLLVIIAGGVALRQLAAPSTASVMAPRAAPAATPAATPVGPPVTPPAILTGPPTAASIAAAPAPARPNPAIAPEDDDAVAGRDVVDKAPAAAVGEAARKRAQVSLRAARKAAKDGDDDKARALAEDAVDQDPRCYECWQTVALLRKRAADVDGARAAKLRAAALAPP